MEPISQIQRGRDLGLTKKRETIRVLVSCSLSPTNGELSVLCLEEVFLPGGTMVFEHMAINVPDVKAIANWYIQHCGLRLVRSLPEEVMIVIFEVPYEDSGLRISLTLSMICFPVISCANEAALALSGY